LRIFLAIYHLETEGKQATGNSIHALLPDIRDCHNIRQRLQHYYIRGYLKRAMVPKKKTTDKKTLWGWSTREAFKYKLNDKGKKILFDLIYRYQQGLDLNLHNRNPQKIDYYKYWTPEDLETAGISQDDIKRCKDAELSQEDIDKCRTTELDSRNINKFPVETQSEYVECA
jgi:hypothetical protein